MLILLPLIARIFADFLIHPRELAKFAAKALGLPVKNGRTKIVLATLISALF